jgi:glyceraldehyde-3-phosphate dehydrogenase (NADP+)
MDDAELRMLFPSESDLAGGASPTIAPVHQRRTLVGGELLPWNGRTVPVLSAICARQADGRLCQLEIGSYPSGGAAEAAVALNAAVAAYDHGRGVWPTMTAGERIVCMQDFASRMARHRGTVVELLMFEIGKTRIDSEKEFDRTADYIRATIDALKTLDNENSRFHLVEGTIGQIRRTPLGVVLCMGPYNYPLNETFATLVPALIMGNTVLLKPPRFGALIFDVLLDAFQAAFPNGVVNMVYGPGAEVVPLLLESGQVNALTLIGSSRVADHLKKLHPKTNRLRAILGLDAKNAAIVLADADIDLAVRECLLGALSFNGQRCTALKMLIVHKDVVETFAQRFEQELEKLMLGMPWQDGVSITPLPDLGKVRYMTDLLADARAHGATILNRRGGASAGTLFYPAIVYPVTEAMKLYREEQFGPIVPIMPFTDVETALDYVVTSDHGQQVSIFTRSPDAVGRLVDPLVNQVCRVNINCQCQRGPDVFPFTGRKDSAEGTLSVTDALRSFSIRSMIAAKQTEASKALLRDVVQQRRSKFVSTDFLF